MSAGGKVPVAHVGKVPASPEGQKVIDTRRRTSEKRKWAADALNNDNNNINNSNNNINNINNNNTVDDEPADLQRAEQPFSELKLLAKQNLKELEKLVATCQAKDQSKLRHIVTCLTMASGCGGEKYNWNQPYVSNVKAEYAQVASEYRQVEEAALSDVEKVMKDSLEQAAALSKTVSALGDRMGLESVPTAAESLGSREGQKRRNETRSEQLAASKEAVSVVSNLQRLRQAAEQELQLKQAAAKQHLLALAVHGELARSAEDLRQESEAAFRHCGKQVQAEVAAAFGGHEVLMRATLSAMERFRLTFLEETKTATAEARKLHEEALAELQQKESRYVSANESPGKNNDYNLVLSTITEKGRLLAEVGSKENSVQSLMDELQASIEELRAHVPEEEGEPPAKKQRRFWDVSSWFGKQEADGGGVDA